MPNMNTLKATLSLLVVWGICAGSMLNLLGDEEFAGPFPSWRNLKTDYGATGDGKADDTARLQRALEDLARRKSFCVLYIPAGEYRLTRTVQLLRKKDADCQGIAIVGESPDKTILRWDGPTNGTVCQANLGYSKVSRLTIDGARRAAVALAYGPLFSTYNETSDLIVRDARIGILFGEELSMGQAENEVLRCQFSHCAEAGIKTANWNSLDIWVWYSRFENCGYALYNGEGNFHAWQNLFLHSSIADVGTLNLGVFSFVNNTSIGSRRFIDFDTGHSWGSPMTISGNRIVDPTADFPLKLGNGGPYLVMDNQFQLPWGSTNRAAKMTWGDQTFVGNVYNTSNAVVEAGRFRRVAETVTATLSLDPGVPALPSTPAHRERKIIEVHARFDWPTDPRSYAWAVQRGLDEADQYRGQRPVVHLPMGVYKIARTLVIPAGSDVQLVGDGARQNGTHLVWTGPPGGLLLELKGPTQASLSDLCLDAPNAHALLVGHADQPGGKIFADQLNASGPSARTNTPTTAVQVNGLEHTDVLFRCLQGSGHSGGWVKVTAPVPVVQPARRQQNTSRSQNQISVFTGATDTSGALGQYQVCNGAALTVRSVYHEKNGDNDTLWGLHLTNSGTLSLDSCKFSYRTSMTRPTVALDNFRGLFTFATSLMVPVGNPNPIRFEISGDGGDCKALALNNLFWGDEPGITADLIWRNVANPPAAGGLIGCNVNATQAAFVKVGPRFGFMFLDELWVDGGVRPTGRSTSSESGAIPDSALLQHLLPIREARVWYPGEVPLPATNLQIHRVMALGGQGAVEFRAAD